MCKIKLQDLLRNKTYPQAGTDLYNIMVDCIDKGTAIELDMSGVLSLPSMFLNTSIGHFIEKNGYEKLAGKLSFQNISAGQAERIKTYMLRTKEYVKK